MFDDLFGSLFGSAPETTPSQFMWAPGQQQAYESLSGMVPGLLQTASQSVLDDTRRNGPRINISGVKGMNGTATADMNPRYARLKMADIANSMGLLSPMFSLHTTGGQTTPGQQGMLPLAAGIYASTL